MLPVERTWGLSVEDTVVVQQNILHPTPRRNSKNATVQTTRAVRKNTIARQVEALEVVRKREIFMQMIFMVLTPVVVIDALVIFGLSRLKYYKFELHHIKGIYTCNHS